jgi:hypothetical protein
VALAKRSPPSIPPSTISIVSHGGNSRSARKRRTRAAILSQRMRNGDPEAAFSLLQRRRALQGIAKSGWRRRLALANAARLGNREHRLAAIALAPEEQRIQAQCVVKSPKLLAALRVRYGSGGVRGDYTDGECRPVAPGGACPACAWRWGNPAPHLIAIS